MAAGFLPDDFYGKALVSVSHERGMQKGEKK
jgi:hypothetical protein